MLYKMQKSLSFETFALSYPVHTWDYGFTWSSYLYLILADMPFTWFLNEVHKPDITLS